MILNFQDRLEELPHFIQWFGSNRCVPPPIRFKPDTDCPRCSCVLRCSRCLFLFWISLSSTIIAIILLSAEVFGGSVCPSLIFSSDNISFKSSWREFCRSDSWSFHIWSIIQPILKLDYNNSCEKQFCGRKSCLSLCMVTQKAWTSLLNNRTRKWWKQLNKETIRNKQTDAIENATKVFFFFSMKVWVCPWLMLCSLEQNVLIIESW